MKKRLLIVSMLILALEIQALASPMQEKNEPQKLTVAIMSLQANDCSPALARGVTDMLAGRVFDTGIFILLERSQMDLILKEQGLSEKGCNTSSCAIQMGKLLSVQKMMMGSVSKLGEYRIELRIVDVSKSSVDISFSGIAADEKKFEYVVGRLVSRTKNYYLGIADITGKYDILLTGAFLYPMGSFAHGAGIGGGSNLYFSWNELNNSRFKLELFSGFYYFRSDLDSIDNIFIVPVELLAGYPFRISENMTLNALAGGGYMLSRVSYDRIQERTGAYHYKTGYFYNPVLTVKPELTILLISRWNLVISPSYSIFFERSRIGHLLSAECGVKISF